MGTTVDEYRRKIRRRAIQMEIGGFRPPDDPLSSWFGQVRFALPGETWPATDGLPMFPLCQLNLTALPFRPPRLDDLEFITVFIGPKKYPVDDENGTNWCLRAYRKIGQLVPLPSCGSGSPLKAFPMRSIVVEEDYPCRVDAPWPMPDEARGRYNELFPNTEGMKLGGWPTLCQGEIYWGPEGLRPLCPEYVFQIDSTVKGNWEWGFWGVGYFGRGTAAGRQDEWAVDWQCY